MSSRRSWRTARRRKRFSHARVRSTPQRWRPRRAPLSTPRRAMRGRMPRLRRSARRERWSQPLSARGLSGRRLGRPRRPERTGGTAPRAGASTVPSWRLAALSVRPSGVPWPSTTTWRLVPGLPRSAGFGPPGEPQARPAPAEGAVKRRRSRKGGRCRVAHHASLVLVVLIRVLRRRPVGRSLQACGEVGRRGAERRVDLGLGQPRRGHRFNADEPPGKHIAHRGLHDQPASALRSRSAQVSSLLEAAACRSVHRIPAQPAGHLPLVSTGCPPGVARRGWWRAGARGPLGRSSP